MVRSLCMTWIKAVVRGRSKAFDFKGLWFESLFDHFYQPSSNTLAWKRKSLGQIAKEADYRPLNPLP